MAAPCSIHSNPQRSQVRAVMLGESGVGKTSLVLILSRYLSASAAHSEPKDDKPFVTHAEALKRVEPTIGAVFHRLSDPELNLGAQIWDPAGGARFQHATHNLVSSSRVVLALFNPRSASSFRVAAAHARRILTSPHADLSLVVLLANSSYHDPDDNKDNNNNNNNNNNPEHNINDNCIVNNNVPNNIIINNVPEGSMDEVLQSMHACVEQLNTHAGNVTIRGMQVSASSAQGIPALWSLMAEHADSQLLPELDSPTASIGSRRSNMSSDSMRSQGSRSSRAVRRMSSILVKQTSAHFRSSTGSTKNKNKNANSSNNLSVVPTAVLPPSIADVDGGDDEKSRRLSASASRLFKIVRRLPRRRSSESAAVAVSNNALAV